MNILLFYLSSFVEMLLCSNAALTKKKKNIYIYIYICICICVYVYILKQLLMSTFNFCFS